LKTYLFDIGNVLLAFDFTPALKALLGKKPHPEALQKIITRKDEFEAGNLTLEEYIPWASKLLDFQGTSEQFSHAWNSIFTPIPETWELAKKLHAQGNRLILFSNINPIHAPYIIKNYSIIKLFHHEVFSYQIKAIKPDSQFFTRAFEKFDIDPTQTIYIDDLPANIETGKKLGLKSFCYDHTTPGAIHSYLKSIE